MSYILDALKRADAERERGRGQVPGLHSQALALDEREEAGSAGGGAPWRWIGAVATVVVLLGVVVWLLWTREATPVAAPAPVPAQPAPPPPAEVPVRDAVPPAAPVVPAPVPAPAVPVSPPMPAPAPAVAPESRPAARPPAVDVPKGKARPAPASAQPQPQAAAPEPVEPEGRTYRISELPDGIRQALPKLNLGGAMYSPKPASRMLIINGQVFHEGDTLAPGVSLRQIRLKDAVLEFKGYRYEVSY